MKEQIWPGADEPLSSGQARGAPGEERTGVVEVVSRTSHAALPRPHASKLGADWVARAASLGLRQVALVRRPRLRPRPDSARPAPGPAPAPRWEMT